MIKKLLLKLFIFLSQVKQIILRVVLKEKVIIVKFQRNLIKKDLLKTVLLLIQILVILIIVIKKKHIYKINKNKNHHYINFLLHKKIKKK